MLHGEISKYLHISKRVAQGCTSLPIYINDLIVAVEAAKEGATMGEDTVSRLMFADDFVGISETPEGLQRQLEETLEYTTVGNEG